MCGIVAYAGSEPALPAILEGLRRLEYRGYDSAGVAAVEGDHVAVAKRAGRLLHLAAALERGAGPLASARAGIGHTRWATHGVPSERNAHPHLDCAGRVAVVHNGIIENHVELRARLEAEGHAFASETDSEVLAHLIEAEGPADLPRAVAHAAGRVEGSLALAAISSADPDRVVVARNESPLVIAAPPGASVAASDLMATMPFSRRAWVLEDRSMALLDERGFEVCGWNGRPAQARSVEIDWDAASAERGGFETFMLKEIHEQPQAIRDTLRGRLALGGLAFEGEPNLARARAVELIGCGSSAHACQVGEILLERLAGIPARADLASEFRARRIPMLDETIVVALSQSGETADTLAAARAARDRGAPVLAITNTLGSRLAREADAVLFTRASPEVSVAATKTFTVQVVALARLAIEIGFLRRMPVHDLEDALAALARLPESVSAVLGDRLAVSRWVERFAGDGALYLGRELAYPVALEGALKLKEIAYRHAHGLAAGEMKHGPIALVERDTPVVGVVAPGEPGRKTHGNLEEVRARGARVFSVGCGEAPAAAEEWLPLPDQHPAAFPVLATVPLQLLAHDVAAAEGIELDRPRNLAKSVTVE